MAIEATDVDQAPQEAQDAQDEPAPAPELPEDPPPAPRTRGRPAGARDKQPRKRPARAAAEQEDESPPRPPTRRSAPPKKRARRVRIVESASSASSASSAAEEELTPRTARHRQWAEYRQQKTDAHQANVNRYAALFDRMLAKVNSDKWQQLPKPVASVRARLTPRLARATTT